MRAPRGVVALAVAVLVFALPLAAAHAEDGDTADSRVGAVLAAACGFALKFTLIAPVPWSGVAAVTCLGAFIDAALSPDENAPSPPPPTP